MQPSRRGLRVCHRRFRHSLATVGAYVLAGELLRANGDYVAAYAQYEAHFRKYAKVSQNVGDGSLLAPTTRFGMYARNRMFSVAFLFKGVIKLVDHFATDIKLEEYARLEEYVRISQESWASPSGKFSASA